MNCWRQQEHGSLHQDVPIEPGMVVYYLHPDRSIERLIVAGENLSWWGAFWFTEIPNTWIATKGPITKFYEAENTYVTEDAAVRAYEMRLSPGEKASFWARVRKGSDTDCWLWAGEVDQDGDGLFRWRKWTYKAHEVAYELSKVKWPVTQICCGPLCCNPNHMADSRNGVSMDAPDEIRDNLHEGQ